MKTLENWLREDQTHRRRQTARPDGYYGSSCGCCWEETNASPKSLSLATASWCDQESISRRRENPTREAIDELLRKHKVKPRAPFAML